MLDNYTKRNFAVSRFYLGECKQLTRELRLLSNQISSSKTTKVFLLLFMSN